MVKDGHHKLRPIDIHLESPCSAFVLYTMPYNISAKNGYAEPVHNKNNENVEYQGLIFPLFWNKNKRVHCVLSYHAI